MRRALPVLAAAVGVVAALVAFDVLPAGDGHGSPRAALTSVPPPSRNSPASPASPPNRDGPPTAPIFGLLAPADGETPPPGPSRQRDPDPSSWAGLVSDRIDSTTIDAAVDLPYGANVLVARIVDGGITPAYAFYQGGGGAFTNDFYVASSIKLLAAVGAAEFARSLGLTGEASIDGGYTIHEVYDAALRWSSNDDYSYLVRIAGMDWLNRQFLPNHGFGATLIQEAYGGEYEQVEYSPEMVLSEGDVSVDVPARTIDGYYGCGGENCTDLFDLADAVRRVALDAEIPAAERFSLAPSDVAGLQEALLDTPSWFQPGVSDLFGPDARVFSKPGWVGGLDCVDAALIDDVATGHRYLLAASAPDYYGGCDMLSTLAYDVLSVVSADDGGVALRTDGSTVAVVGGRQFPRRVP